MRKCAIYDERMRCIGVAGLYRPVEQQIALRDCDGCGCIEPVVRGLNAALSLLPPELMRRYEEMMDEKEEDGEADELKLS